MWLQDAEPSKASDQQEQQQQQQGQEDKSFLTWAAQLTAEVVASPIFYLFAGKQNHGGQGDG